MINFICGFLKWPILRGRSGDSEKRDFCLGSSAFQALVMMILCKREGRKKAILQMDFIQRCRECSTFLWLWTRPQEPNTSKSCIRIHKSSPALSICLSLAEHTTFRSAPRFPPVRGSSLQWSAEEKPCMGWAPALPGRGPSLTFASPAPNAWFSSWITYSAFPATQEGFNKLNLEQLGEPVWEYGSAEKRDYRNAI